MTRPLDSLRSIKVKLGALVAASVLVAALLATLGSAVGIPDLLTIPVAVALSLAVTQLLAAGMVEPLRRMTEIAQQMAKGDLSGRVSTDSSDEVGRLARAFNQMAADLARVDEERRDLIATVSHELRTPLAAMTAVLENLADGVVPADSTHLDQAVDQAGRLHALVGDLLDLSRLEAGVARLDVRETTLAPLVGECVAQVRAAGRTADYDVVVPDDLVVRADPERLRQLLVNVLDNSGRHSLGSRPVRVSADTEDGHWWLEVSDDGPGVPETERERVFERFGTDPSGGGTGLGLAISRWVAELHGGSLRFVEPDAARGGALLRLHVPTVVPTSAPRAVPAAGPTAGAPQGRHVGSEIADVPAPTPGTVDALFGRFWPEHGEQAGLLPVLSSASVGLLAGATMTFSGPGLSWTVVLVAAGAAALATARRRSTPFTVACSALALLLVLPVTLLGNHGLAMLCVLVAAGVFLAGTTGAATFRGFLFSGVSWPLAALRGLPWLGRTLRLVGSTGRTPAVVRTLVWSTLALAVFGALFASADALFATWVDALVPNLSFGDMVARGFVAVAVSGMTLGAAYLGMNPPLVDPAAPSGGPVRNRFEWLVPVLLVDAVLALFMAAQAAVFFGGHDYLLRTTGLTYAEHVHQGFGQLTLATALTLLVVWAAARRAGRGRSDQWWLRGSLGLLLALTLVVVGSALHRMQLYQEAYGFTTLRLVVDVFEGWLGGVVVAVMVTGLLGLGRWVPRIALVTGALGLLGLVAVNPDRWVAEHNIDRYEATGKLDLGYLQSLSVDATGVIAARLPRSLAGCALQDRIWDLERREEGLSGWNLGQERAQRVIDDLDLGWSGVQRSSCEQVRSALESGSPDLD